MNIVNAIMPRYPKNTVNADAPGEEPISVNFLIFTHNFPLVGLFLIQKYLQLNNQSILYQLYLS